MVGRYCTLCYEQLLLTRSSLAQFWQVWRRTSSSPFAAVGILLWPLPWVTLQRRWCVRFFYLLLFYLYIFLLIIALSPSLSMDNIDFTDAQTRPVLVVYIFSFSSYYTLFLCLLFTLSLSLTVDNTCFAGARTRTLLCCAHRT